MSDKHFYAWVRVGDGDPEPAAITGEKPHRKATTIGCPDTFDVDDPESGCSVVLLAWKYGGPREGRAGEALIEWEDAVDFCSSYCEVTPVEAAEREQAYQQAIREKPHSYAGFGKRRRP